MKILPGKGRGTARSVRGVMLSGPVFTVRRARKLRREMSLPEILLWNVLRARTQGLKFRRQHAVGPYVVDFYCHAARLVVEIDGESHSRGDQPVIDQQRDAYLARNGQRVLRIQARHVLRDCDAVLQQIVATAADVSPLHHPANGPPPLEGEEF